MACLCSLFMWKIACSLVATCGQMRSILQVWCLTDRDNVLESGAGTDGSPMGRSKKYSLRSNESSLGLLIHVAKQGRRLGAPGGEAGTTSFWRGGVQGSSLSSLDSSIGSICMRDYLYICWSFSDRMATMEDPVRR